MKQQKATYLIIAIVIIFSAIIKIALYPYNYSSMIALALFSGAVVKDRKYAWAMPIFAMLLSDILLEVFHIAQGFWGWGQMLGYFILILISLFGSFLKRISIVNVLMFSLSSSIIFYLLSNSSVFVLDCISYHYYPQNMVGYIDCMAAGIPFLLKSLVNDLLYSALFFTGYALLRKWEAVVAV